METSNSYHSRHQISTIYLYTAFHSFMTFDSLNNTLPTTRRLMENNLLQTNRVKQLTPLLLRPLERANLDHHHDTHARSGKITVSIRDDILINNEAGIPRFHSFDNIGEDLAGLLIGPIMKDPVQKICPSTCRRDS